MGAGSAAYMIGLEIFEAIPFQLNVEHFLAVAFGGAILGGGLSIILRLGGCIDGSEILANVIVNKVAQKKGFNMSMTGILIGFNACVYAAGFKRTGVLRLMICGLVKNMMEQVLSRTCSIIFFCSQHPEFITQIEEYSSDERR